jgi:hypothetical protein
MRQGNDSTTVDLQVSLAPIMKVNYIKNETKAFLKAAIGLQFCQQCASHACLDSDAHRLRTSAFSDRVQASTLIRAPAWRLERF